MTCGPVVSTATLCVERDFGLWTSIVSSATLCVERDISVIVSWFDADKPADSIVAAAVRMASLAVLMPVRMAGLAMVVPVRMAGLAVLVTVTEWQAFVCQWQ